MNEVTKVTPLVPVDPMVSMIERVAMDPAADLAKLERMLDLKEKHEADEAKKAFSAAFALASASFPTIPLNGKGHNNKPYATLKDIISHTRPVLSQHGLALTFSIDVGDQITVTAELMHKAGHSKSTSIALPRDTSGSKNAVQAVGSTQTYGQRYTAQAVLGLSLGDDTEDDGNAASGSTVSPDQFIQLRNALEESGMDPVKFNVAFGHPDPANAMLEQFPAARFDEAMRRLAAYKEKARENA